MFQRSVLRIVSCIFILASGCSKLDEQFQGDLTRGQVGGASQDNATILLQGLYYTLEAVFTNHLTVFPLQELCTDEAIAPTRGQDWDDNGVWRVLHQQKWISNNDKISECFKALNGLVYSSTDLLNYNATAEEQAEARFIRAWAMYLVLDLFDQVPYRDPGESLILEARVRKGLDALNYIISELNAILPDLAPGPEYKANKDAARFLLMKCYLNKGVYQNRSDPVFIPADMNKVIGFADDIIRSNKYTFCANYFDNFAPDNGTKGRENIFTLQNIPGATPNNNVFFGWIIGLHYNQAIATNGWTTLSDFYNTFESNDKRRGLVYSIPGSSPPNPANEINVGFLIGQQYDYFTGAPLIDGTGAPLIFTPEVKNTETGSNLQVTGIRAIKYFPDWTNYFSPDNDFVFYRLSDVLLMKAEAILRGGSGTAAGPYGDNPTAIVNAMRTDSSRSASKLTLVSLEDVYKERGRELWWEGWRRQDMIRFKKFLLPFQEKNYVSDPKYLVYPIPDDQIAVNRKYLVQNPGY